MALLKDKTGRRYGRLVVLRLGIKRGVRYYWECRCDCGVTTEVSGANLVSSQVLSCGCLWKESITKHGQNQSPTYRVWQAMKQRCGNPKADSYIDYGARGIKVCARWKTSFESFLSDMGKKPTSNHSIERLDNSKGYFKSNCIWATPSIQLRNTRRNRNITFLGRTQCITDWAKELGLAANTITYRLERKWPLKTVLSTGRFFVSKSRGF